MIELQNQEHLFSLYAPKLNLKDCVPLQSLLIEDVDLVHRMFKVLRFQVHDVLLLFNDCAYVHVRIEQISKKSLLVRINSVNFHDSQIPSVTFLLPLLKKDALEQAVYSLAEMGVNKIQLVVTDKSRKNLINIKEFERLQNIIIAACEQSKNYCLPELFEPVSLSKFVSEKNIDTCCIVFDPSGKSFWEIKKDLDEKPKMLIVGPEGGFTLTELEFLHNQKFVSCALTSTVLRAVQAVALAAGLVRLQ